MSFPPPAVIGYNGKLPNPPDDPADDVGGMQTNSAAIPSLISIDHVSFNTSGGGWHNQVTFANTNFNSLLPPDPVSQLVTGVTTNSGGHPSLIWKNSQAIYNCIPLKAFVTFVTISSVAMITPSAAYGPTPTGVQQTSNTSPSTVRVTFDANRFTNNPVCFLITAINPTGSGTVVPTTWTFSNPNLTITFLGTGSAGIIVNLIGLQV